MTTRKAKSKSEGKGKGKGEGKINYNGNETGGSKDKNNGRDKSDNMSRRWLMGCLGRAADFSAALLMVMP
jgi:hypothetical protein